MDAPCEECGNHGLEPLPDEAGRVFECRLCGALAGAEPDVARILLIREARAAGVHPELYPIVRFLGRLPGLSVRRSHPGDAGERVWPFVQLGPAGPPEATLRSLDNLARSLALSAASQGVHWVLELEFQGLFVCTLKPRFHRDVERIGPAEIESARRDVEVLRRNLERDLHLSWWQR